MSITNDTVKRLLTILNLPPSSYAVCGGALLAHHGLRLNENDIDLLALPPLLDKLKVLWVLKQGSQPSKITPTIEIDGVRIEAFSSTNFNDTLQAIKFVGRAQVHDGIPFVRLEDMLEWKVSILEATPNLKSAEKHALDVELMKKALCNTPST